MSKGLRLALAQLNLTVGAVEENRERILATLRRAKEAGANLFIAPELAISGYPPEDLLLKPQFIQESERSLQALAKECHGIIGVVGAPIRSTDSGDLHNSAAVMADGRIQAVYRKVHLPNYAVFDEARYFRPGSSALVLDLGTTRVGLTICEDIWYGGGPAADECLVGAELIVNISASPYHMGKPAERERMLRTRAADNIAAVAFCNLIGGQDELVFDGSSLVVGPDGEIIARARQFSEELLLVDVNLSNVQRLRLRDTRLRQGAPVMPVEMLRLPGWQQVPNKPLCPEPVTWLEGEGEVYQALVLATRDYVLKNGFADVVVGVSGGIDSALVACIAVDALGPEHVHAVFMPSRYSSHLSQRIAEDLCGRLGVHYLLLPIDGILAAYLSTLAATFGSLPSDVTEENIQARIRGNLLMALSNKFGWLVVTTGNKSELATGYCTLYGDMAGGFAVIKDVPKTLVYRLARYRNQLSPVIPAEAISRAPSAELRPDQRDDQALPPYPVLDAILKAYVEDDFGVSEIAAMGLDENLVREVATLVDRSEYKRRQGPPGVRISRRAFGKDRRLPITNGYHPSS